MDNPVENLKFNKNDKVLMFERDSGIRVGIFPNGTFSLVAVVKDSSNKVKRLSTNYATSQEVCDSIKLILDNQIDTLEEVIVLSRKVLRGEHKENHQKRVRDMRAALKAQRIG